MGGKQPAEDAADNVSDGEYVDLAAVAVTFTPVVVSLNRYLIVSRSNSGTLSLLSEGDSSKVVCHMLRRLMRAFRIV